MADPSIADALRIVRGALEGARCTCPIVDENARYVDHVDSERCAATEPLRALSVLERALTSAAKGIILVPGGDNL